MAFVGQRSDYCVEQRKQTVVGFLFTVGAPPPVSTITNACCSWYEWVNIFADRRVVIGDMVCYIARVLQIFKQLSNNCCCPCRLHSLRGPLIIPGANVGLVFYPPCAFYANCGHRFNSNQQVYSQTECKSTPGQGIISTGAPPFVPPSIASYLECVATVSAKRAQLVFNMQVFFEYLLSRFQ
jgi:hypothetical protein